MLSRIVITYTGGTWYIAATSDIGGNKFSQIGSPSRNYLPSVTTSGLVLVGNGTVSNPLNADPKIADIHTITFANSPYTIGTNNERVLIVDKSGGNIIVNFPAANSIFCEYTVKIISSSLNLNKCVLTPAIDNTIDGGDVDMLSTNASYKLQSNGVDGWLLTSAHKIEMYALEIGSGIAFGTAPALYNNSYSGVQRSYSATATSGYLTVKANVPCGMSSSRTLYITVNDCTPKSGTLTGNAEKSTIDGTPAKNELKVYPNPSTGPVTFEFRINENAKATLDIFGVTGKRIARIFDADVESDVIQTVNFDESLPSGIYVYVLKWNDQVITGKLIRKR